MNVSSFPKKTILGMIRFYKREISPVLPPSCRFIPTCSQYALDALSEWGVFRGSALALWRILRCNPFGGCGHDPVPRRNYKKIDPLKDRKK